MKKGITSILALMLSLPFMITGCGSKGEEKNADLISYRTMYSTSKFEKNDDVMSKFSDTSINISMAKGEKEGAQFVLKADFSVNEYDVTVSDLVCGNNKIPKENIDIYVELYSKCLAIQNGGVLPAGEYTDALIPIEYIKQAKQNNIEKGENRAFFIDVEALNDTASGVYSGAITVSYDGVIKTIPVTCKVYDFALPKTPTSKSSFSIWRSLSNFMFYGEHDDSVETYMKYYDKLLEYNLCAPEFPTNDPEKFVEYVKEYYNAIPCFKIGSNYDNGYDWEEYLQNMKLLAEASVEDGVNYFEKAYYNFAQIYDEASNTTKINQTIASCDAYEEQIIEELYNQGTINDKNCDLAQTIRGLRHVITIDKKLDLTGSSVNFVCVKNDQLYYSSEIDRYDGLAKDYGFTVWSYACIGGDAYPYYSNQINDYLISERNQLWFNYVNDYEGFLQWCVNAYCNFNSSTKEGWGLVEDLYTTAAHNGKDNGDGYLFYPGADYGSEEPFPSLRLVALRDGMDDYDYMSILESLYSESGASADNVINYLAQTVIARNVSTLSDENTNVSRETLAKLIEMYNEHKLVVSGIGVDKNVLSYKVYADKSKELKINGNTVNPSQVGGELKCYEGSVDLTLSNKFEVAVGEDSLKISTGKNTQVALNFDNGVSAISVSKDSSVVKDTAFSYARSNATAKINLTGRVFADADRTKTYMPNFTIGLFNSVKLTDTENIEIYIYNDGNSDRVFDISLVDVQDNSYLYDKVTLKAKQWNKIQITNLQALRLSNNIIKSIVSINFSCDNILNGSSPSLIPLYIDEIRWIRGQE